ncbi:MAG: precorrin-6A/cobalt-precorrin-6A reductase [Gammaproteobacteria bacterium]|nr:precorrin-6A/cobalt-precorrin-6A reductase [Gammaproteobacteria bacterium]
MNILVLGGIAESKALAGALVRAGHIVVYSIAGLVRQPDLPCEIHSGGFSREGRDGILGLADYCREKAIALLIDSTHPYAEGISAHAVAAAHHAGISCWRFNRPGWDRKNHPNWEDYLNWQDLLPKIEPYHRPFFTIGRSALGFADQRARHQIWMVRSAKPFADVDGVTQINAIGPFSLEEELALMHKHRIDALISKNSGCTRVSAKLEASRQLGIPVFVQVRPGLVPAARSFDSIDSLMDAIPTV